MSVGCSYMVGVPNCQKCERYFKIMKYENNEPCTCNIDPIICKNKFIYPKIHKCCCNLIITNLHNFVLENCNADIHECCCDAIIRNLYFTDLPKCNAKIHKCVCKSLTDIHQPTHYCRTQSYIYHQADYNRNLGINRFLWLHEIFMPITNDHKCLCKISNDCRAKYKHKCICRNTTNCKGTKHNCICHFKSPQLCKLDRKHEHSCCCNTENWRICKSRKKHLCRCEKNDPSTCRANPNKHNIHQKNPDLMSKHSTKNKCNC